MSSAQIDGAAKGVDNTQVNGAVGGIDNSQVGGAASGIDNLSMSIKGGVIGALLDQNTQMIGAIKGLDNTQISGAIKGLDNSQVGGAVIGAFKSINNDSIIITPSKKLNLRNTSVWGNYENVVTIPHGFGTVTLTPILYSDAGNVFVALDHNSTKVIDVRVNDLSILFSWFNGLDISEHPVTFIRIPDALNRGDSISATVVGKVDNLTGQIVNPADVVFNLLTTLSDIQISRSDLSFFRAEMAELEIEISGVIDDENKTIKQYLREILIDGVGASWASNLREFAMMYPLFN